MFTKATVNQPDINHNDVNFGGRHDVGTDPHRQIDNTSASLDSIREEDDVTAQPMSPPSLSPRNVRVSFANYLYVFVTSVALKHD
jgi:hypothetical protein